MTSWWAERSFRSAVKTAQASLERARHQLQASALAPSPDALRVDSAAVMKVAAEVLRAVEAAKRYAETEQRHVGLFLPNTSLPAFQAAAEAAQAMAKRALHTVQAPSPNAPPSVGVVALTPDYMRRQLELVAAANDRCLSSVEALQSSVAFAQQKERENREALRQRQRYLAQFGGIDPTEVISQVQMGRFAPAPAGILLRGNEVAIFSTPVTLAEDKTTSQRVGGSIGYSFPVGHGVRFRVGSYQGRTISTTQLTKIDHGELVVTTQRVVFSGARGNVVIPAQKIINTVLHANGVDIRAENRQRREVFLCRNPRLVNTYILIACQLAMA